MKCQAQFLKVNNTKIKEINKTVERVLSDSVSQQIA